ncbi:hypothetical protein Neosp_011100 [[Neocosmospora] mangrovei]
MPFSRNGLLVIGAGGMGLAIARRLGPGRRVFLADYSKDTLESAANSLRDTGHDVETQIVDVSSFESVTKLAKHATSTSTLNTVVNTAGISPSMGTARQIFEVDLLGTANVIDAFLDTMPPGSSLTTVASIAGALYGGVITPELEQHLATAPKDKLLQHASIDLDGNPGVAYGISKRGNIVRAQAAVKKAGTKGIRINSISPGVITTAMIRSELESETGENVRQMVKTTPIPRAGSADEIASIVAFVSGPEASFVNGADFVIDGGFVASTRFNTPAEALEAN